MGLARLAGGDLIVASTTTTGTDFAVTRLHSADGSIDTTFGTNGLATANPGGTDDADRVVTLPSGKLMVLGTSTTGGTVSTAAVALNSNGTPDTTFGTAGVRTFDPVAVSAVRSSVSASQDASGNVFVGRINDGGSSRCAASRATTPPPPR